MHMAIVIGKDRETLKAKFNKVKGYKLRLYLYR